MRTGEKGVKKYQEWVKDVLKPGDQLGFDPSLLTSEEVTTRKSDFEGTDISFTPISPNPIDSLWSNRPSPPRSTLFPHPLQYAGLSTMEKAELVCKQLLTLKQRYVLTTDLAEIAWVLNMRGGDIPFNPLFYAYLVVERGSDGLPRLHIFSDYSEDLQSSLASAAFVFRPYSQLPDWLSTVKDPIVCDKSHLNFALFSMIPHVKHTPSLISQLKMVKSRTELAGFQSAHIRDAVAFVQFWAWLRSTLQTRTVTECEAAKMVDSLRAAQPLYHSPSFDTISASAANGAIVHYRPTGEVAISRTAPYLIDSGGHYMDGTTDVTRTIHFGHPTAAQKAAYTRVLLGNLDLERTIWPAGVSVSGGDLDSIARRRVWEGGLDYRHGTGHGVGHFLCVHEGPVRIAKSGITALDAGMVLSNEPGYYKEGQFGVRIENLLEVEKHTGIEGFLRFRRLTMVPYDRNLVEVGLMTKQDVELLNSAHEEMRGKLEARLQGENLSLELLRWATAPL